MRNTHHLFRAISLTIGLALLVVTGTAAMMAVFSSGPAYAPRAYGQMVLAPLPEAAQTLDQALSPAGDDHVLYQRVARADGTQVWELTPAAQSTEAPDNRSNAVVATRPTFDAPGFSRVSYSLQARPAGFSKTLKSCAHAVIGQGARLKTMGAYDISCTTLG
ncbi:hypothetical protein [Polaromonas sp.]|uniref:hypothetical protein n=1 Tax=Polaromonas sp. TaxID=1869339 RepID=UPI00248A7CBD|nr:hypothetical protein [Polaromonas sp.]MDI1340562.1 hypothetical protein [Polaromonas sp.]